MRKRFIVDTKILLNFLLEDKKKDVADIIKYLSIHKNGFICSFSLGILFSELYKLGKNPSKELYKLLNFLRVIKTPSYVSLEHPLAKKDMNAYLIHLSAESINAFIITQNENLLNFSKRALLIKDFFKMFQNKSDKYIPFLDIPSQNMSLYPKIEKKFDDIISNARFIAGKYVKRFEEQFANYLKAKYSIGVNSGTSALITALMAIGLKPGDEVIMSVNTFIATAEAVSILGGKPVFVDIHPKYYTIDVTQIEDKITKKTKAIIPVHLYGQCADMEAVIKIAKKYNLWVIEDACQAHGAEFKGMKAGTLAHLGCFSFYPGKNLGAWGEGGAVVTDNSDLAEKLYKIRNHGEIKKYDHDLIGGNFRMSEFQGAVLLEKLKYLDDWNKKRRQVAEYYRKYLGEFEKIGYITLPKEKEDNKHVYHLYVIQINKGDRDEFIEFFKKHGIECGIHYPQPLHLTNAYKELARSQFPVAEKVMSKIVSLPIGDHLKEQDVIYVKSIMQKFFNKRDS